MQRWQLYQFVIIKWPIQPIRSIHTTIWKRPYPLAMSACSRGCPKKLISFVTFICGYRTVEDKLRAECHIRVKRHLRIWTGEFYEKIQDTHAELDFLFVTSTQRWHIFSWSLVNCPTTRSFMGAFFVKTNVRSGCLIEHINLSVTLDLGWSKPVYQNVLYSPALNFFSESSKRFALYRVSDHSKLFQTTQTSIK